MHLLHNRFKWPTSRQVESCESEFRSRETSSQRTGVKALRCWDFIFQLGGPHDVRGTGLGLAGMCQLSISPDECTVTIELGPVDLT
jgi:hypothetical protein